MVSLHVAKQNPPFHSEIFVNQCVLILSKNPDIKSQEKQPLALQQWMFDVDNKYERENLNFCLFK